MLKKISDLYSNEPDEMIMEAEYDHFYYPLVLEKQLPEFSLLATN